MVSKQMRRHQTAGGQTSGAERNVNSGGHDGVPDQAYSTEKLGKGQTRRRRRTSKEELSDSVGEDDDDEEEKNENALRFPDRFGNQLGELGDSERVFPAPTSHVASLNRELKALETRYFRTRLSLEKVTEKVRKLSVRTCKLYLC